MANGDLQECGACGGDGFVVERCGCRDWFCPHESLTGYTSAIEPRPGLYQKFWVRRTDGSSREGEKHEDCAYFVLDWQHDPFAVVAARAYADACAPTHPELAADLRERAKEAAERWCALAETDPTL